MCTEMIQCMGFEWVRISSTDSCVNAGVQESSSFIRNFSCELDSRVMVICLINELS